MCIENNKMKKGLTLIETILYLGLLSFLLSAAMPLLLNLYFEQSTQTTFAEATQEYVFTEAKVRNLINTAGAVTSPRAGEFSDTLRVNDANQNTTTIFLNGKTLFMDKNNETLVLNSTSTPVTNLSFYQSEGTGIKTISFGIEISSFNFGTTSYVIKNE